MGVGKSTIGARLAERLGRVFIDTDREIERRERRDIASIFATDGEETFRRLEAEVIQAAEMDGAVIALGGGAVAQPGAIDRLLESGEVVYLKADVGVLLARIGDAASRPLLAHLMPSERLERLSTLLGERLPDYERARIHVDATGTADDVVERVLDELARN